MASAPRLRVPPSQSPEAHDGCGMQSVNGTTSKASEAGRPVLLSFDEMPDYSVVSPRIQQVHLRWLPTHLRLGSRVDLKPCLRISSVKVSHRPSSQANQVVHVDLPEGVLHTCLMYGGSQPNVLGWCVRLRLTGQRSSIFGEMQQ